VPSAWTLLLDRCPGDPARRVGGLPLVLRLGIEAQRAGADSIVVACPEAERVRATLRDPRLWLPVLDSAPPDTRSFRAPATLVVHPAVLGALSRASEPSDRDLAAERVPPDAAYGFDPIVVTDTASARSAERALFRSLRKPQDGWTSRWLNRPISLSISRVLVKTPLHPNHVSVVILAIGLAGAALAARGDYWSILAGAALFHAQSVLDGCDGEMSRITYRGSLTGQWLDTIGDDLTNYAFFGALALGLHRTTGQAAYLAAGAIGVAAGIVASGIEYRYLVRIGSGDLLKYPLTAADASSGGGGAFETIRPLFKRDTAVFLTLVAAALAIPGVMLFAFAAGAVGVLLSVILAELRMAKERSLEAR
jgi:phosphatidylglycerophosphate synthase